jgi:hypothetical protein
MGKKVRGMTEVLSNRNFTLATTKGHVIFFKKGRPQMCPNVILEDAIAVGIIPVDEADLPGGEADRLLPVEPVGTERIRQIRDIIESLMRRNGRNDFTASGLPNINVVSSALGYKIDVTELGRVWHIIRQENADSRILEQDDRIEEGPERPEDPEELKVAFAAALDSVMETGTQDDFTAGGTPLVRSMVNRLGYDVSEDERDASWADWQLRQKAKTPAASSKTKPKKAKVNDDSVHTG